MYSSSRLSIAQGIVPQSNSPVGHFVHTSSFGPTSVKQGSFLKNPSCIQPSFRTRTRYKEQLTIKPTTVGPTGPQSCPSQSTQQPNWERKLLTCPNFLPYQLHTLFLPYFLVLLVCFFSFFFPPSLPRVVLLQFTLSRLELPSFTSVINF